MGNNLEIKYIVYQTVNTVNNKIYIGVHETNTPYKFDGYLGCKAWINNPNSYNKSKYPLHNAILKYGVKSFRRSTIQVFDTLQEALELESELVTEEFISRTDTYNTISKNSFVINRPIYQFDLNGNFIKKWKSELDIRNYYKHDIPMFDIISKKRIFSGFLWNLDNQIDRISINGGQICQYNPRGILLNTFKTPIIAAQKLDLDPKAITQAVFKKKKYSGYYFLMSNVDIAEVLINKPKKNKQMIYRYLLTGEFDTQFESVLKAVKSVPSLSKSKLTNSLLNKKQAKGYYWSHIKSDNYFNIQD